jgi:4-amino-4-deoxy-L-arabinose transferase-like glycosyltransferase
MNSTLAPPHRITWPHKRAARPASQTLAAERSEPSWARPALIALLLCTALAYMIDLSASGYANTFYAAAVQAGTKSWKAFFFGSIDSSNFITVDKPPASLWVMAISGRIFGFSSWSMLVPQALEGVAAVALLHASVKRWFGAGAGLAAGALFALTPVAALMFRFNNPDALLVCLLVAGAYCLTRAIEGASTRWVLAAGTMIGLAFLAKMMQAFLVLPAFALVYMVAAPTGLRRRLAQVLAGAAAIVVSAGWWVAIVALWPASSRPFIDGSPDNSILNLITGYNGLGRIFGASGPGGGGGGANFSGSTGVLRLFNNLMGGQASWLLPAALLAVVAGVWSTRRAPRTDRTRAALMLWGGWLVVSGLVFSLGSGVIHTYYTVALAPAIAAPIAIMGSRLWKKRHEAGPRALVAVAVLLTAGWSWVLLDRTPHWESWLLVLIPVSALIALVGLLAAPALRRLGRGAAAATAAFALVACLTGPVAYSAETISTAHTGSIPSAGPATGGAGGGPGGAPGGASARTAARSGTVSKLSTGTGKPAGAGLAGGGGGATGGGTQSVSSALKKALEADAGSYRWVAAVSGSQSAASLELATGGDPVMAIGGFNNEGGNLSLAQFKRYVAAGEIHYYLATSNGGAPTAGGGASGGTQAQAQAGGRAPGAAQSGSAAQSLFGGGQSGTGTPPGASALGSRPTGAAGGAPTGARGIPGGGGASSSSSAITAWVKAHYKAVTIGGQTVYDLTRARS